MSFKIAFFMLCSAALLYAQTLPTNTLSLFSGSGNCEGCHSAQGETFVTAAAEDISPISTWRSTMMANAAKDPLWQAKVTAEVTAHPHLQTVIEDKCTTCHAPMARTEAVYTDSDAYTMHQALNDPMALDGVSCTLCHQIQNKNLGTDDSFSGHYQITNDHEIFGPYTNPTTMPMFNQTGFTPVYSPHIKSSQICATCHTLFTPFVDDNGDVAGTFPEQTPYLEWENSTYAKEGIDCQTCHMPAVDEAIKIASLPPWLTTKRQPVWKHDFVGGNTFMVSLLKDNADAIGVTAQPAHFDSTLAKEERLLQYSTIDLSFDGYFAADSLVINVNVKNLAGHKFPTGFPSRRAWLCVEVKNSKDEIVFLSGAWDEHGEIYGLDEKYEPHFDHITHGSDVQIYESIMQDVNGDVTFTLLRGAAYAKDNRLPPHGFLRDAERYQDIAIAGEAEKDNNFNANANGEDVVTYKIAALDNQYQVSVSMYYQSVSPRFVNDLFNYDTEQITAFKQFYQSQKNEPVLLKKVQKDFSLSGIKDEFRPLPAEFGLNSYPNPFNASTNFKFELRNPAFINLSIYNQTGQKLITLVDKSLNAGQHIVRWNGQNVAAAPVASGLYIAVLHVDGVAFTSRILMLR